MKSEAWVFADELFSKSHDEQTAIIIDQESEFLREVLLRVSSRQDWFIEQTSSSGGIRPALRGVIESTYTWAIITTVLRMRGKYGKIRILLDGRMEVL